MSMSIYLFINTHIHKYVYIYICICIYIYTYCYMYVRICAGSWIGHGLPLSFWGYAALSDSALCKAGLLSHRGGILKYALSDARTSHIKY